MSYQKALAKLEDVTRRIERGKGNTLHLVDKVSREVLGQIHVWNWEQFNPVTPTESGPTYIFSFISPLSKEVTNGCDLAFDLKLYDVTYRQVPEGSKEILWKFRAKPTNEYIVL